MRPLLFLAAPLLASISFAQDLYDPGTLRTVDVTFDDANWWTLLEQNYASQTLILADLTMEGVTYPDVGVRIRGNTSYTRLPPGSQKVSLAIDMDFTDPDQDLLGYNTLNLNNAFTDPTFCREVTYNNFVSRYIPNARSNHVLLTIGGQDWGVYVNVQQFNKDMLRDYFDDETGMRSKCPNNPNGPGLSYVGNNQNSYNGDYEIKDDGGLVNPWNALIAVCNVVTNTLPSNWEQADTVVAIDPSIWSVVLENLFADDDSYINKGADFTMYRNPVDGRTHLLQTDGNESFHSPTWAIDYNFNAANKPFLNNLLSDPELRARYMAHMRTALEEFDWNQLSVDILASRALIEAHVATDPKKIYSYANFVTNFTGSVNLGGPGPGGGAVVGLQPFVNQRESLLSNHPEILSPAPTIAWVSHEPTTPDPSDAVYVTARVGVNVDPIASVELFYLATPGSYQRVAMFDDGLNGDSAAGDGIYGVQLPVSAVSGQEVSYYVAATANNAYGSVMFSPALTELQPAKINYLFGYSGMRITEFLYSGSDGEFVELTNTGSAPVDMAGWSMDDQSNVAGSFDLSAAGIVMPGQSIVITDEDPVLFGTAWGLAGVVVVGPTSEANLGRNDEINIYDASGDLVERLTYGDEDFPGSVRTKDASGQLCAQSMGTNNPFGATLAMASDAFGSYVSTGGDLGSPGLFLDVTCDGLGTEYCNPAVPNSTGQPGRISAFGSSFVDANNLTLVATDLPPGEFGIFVNGTGSGVTPNAGGFAGTLCLSNTIGRYNRASQIFMSDASGQATLALDLATTPTPFGPTPILAGETWYFQGWFRDTPASTANFTSAISVVFQ
ncbi:MAG: CotH kinase family protein [Planctomycetota bacterium]|nr:CotH kinase family protein [Planctomycetota bacterium]